MGLSPGGAAESSYRRLPPPSPSVPTQPSSSEVGESSEEHESSNDVEYHQLLKDYRDVQADLSLTRLNTETLHGELDATCDALQASKNLASQAQADLAIAQQQAQHMMNLVVVLSTWVDTLQMSVLAACNAAFPIGKVDNLFAAEEHLQALLAYLRAIVTKAIHQGASTTLAAVQL